MATKTRAERSQPSQHTNKPTYFFKIIFSPVTEGIKIPTAFMRNYGDELKGVVLLRVPTGASWPVQLLRIGDGTWLDKGWQEFAAYYGIELHHFLLFRYDGDSRFRVVICDKSASEIDYPAESNEEEEDDVSEDEDAEIGEDDFSEDESVGREPINLPRVDGGGPSFSFTMTKTYQSRMIFPAFYVRQARLQEKKKISLINPNIPGMKHEVRLFKTGKGRLCTGKGWSSFRKYSSLKLGREYIVTLVGNQNDRTTSKLESRDNDDVYCVEILGERKCSG